MTTKTKRRNGDVQQNRMNRLPDRKFKMKVFLSWSGERSHKVAIALRDWLPSVIQSIEPYVSSEDIDKGARWGTDIAKELDASMFGILCVTKENIESPWLLFEAGALSKSMDKSLVSPLLFDLTHTDINNSSPLLQFQTTKCNCKDIKKLVDTLNKACAGDGLEESQLLKAFDKWFPDLEEALGLIGKAESEQAEDRGQAADAQCVLDEILEVARGNRNMLKAIGDSLVPNTEPEGRGRVPVKAVMNSRPFIEYETKRRENVLADLSSRPLGSLGNPHKWALIDIRDVLPSASVAGIDAYRCVRSRSRSWEAKQEAVLAFKNEIAKLVQLGDITTNGTLHRILMAILEQMDFALTSNREYINSDLDGQ